MFCMCEDEKIKMAGGAIFLLVGILYIAQSMSWIKMALPNFWAVLLFFVGLFMLIGKGTK